MPVRVGVSSEQVRTAARRHGGAAEVVATRERPLQGLRQWVRRVPADWALAALVGVGALALNLPGLATTSLSFDEAMSVGVARQPASVMWQYLWGPEDHMTLYYLLLSAWLHLTGLIAMAPTELVVRLPSAVFSASAAVVVFLIGRRCFGRAVGLIASGLYALNALELYEAQKARSYSLQLLLLAVGWYALFAILAGTRHPRRWWAAFIGAMTLAVYAQPFSALVVAAEVVAMAGTALLPGPWQVRARRAFVGCLLSVAAICALSVPEAIDALLHGQSNEWVPVARLGDVAGVFGAIAGGNVVLICLMLLLLALTLAAAARSRRTPGPTAASREPLSARAPEPLASLPAGTFVLACWLVVPIVLSFAATQPYLNAHLFWWRYLCVVVAPLCLLVAVGTATFRPPAARYGLTLLLLVVAIPSALGYYASAQLTDFKTAAGWLAANYRSGDGVTYLPGKVCSIPMEYYGQVNHSPFGALADAPGSWLWADQREVPSDVGDISGYASRHARVFLVLSSYGVDPATAARMRAEQGWLDSHYHLVAQRAAQDVTVRLYVTGGTAATTPSPSG